VPTPTATDTGRRFIRSHLKDRYQRPTVGFEPGTQRSLRLRSNHCATRAVMTILLIYITHQIYNLFILVKNFNLDIKISNEIAI
jgi:hypothetical protein